MPDESKSVGKLELIVISLLIGLFAYAFWRVECPFCHAGRVDATGRCSLGDNCRNFYGLPQWDEWSDKEKSRWIATMTTNRWGRNKYRGHHKAITCSWCSGSGKMSRAAIW